MAIYPVPTAFFREPLTPTIPTPYATDMTLWLESDYGVTSGGGTVSNWADRTGVAGDWTTGGNEPDLIVGGGKRGSNIIRFTSASEQHLVGSVGWGAAAPLAVGCEIFMVVKGALGPGSSNYGPFAFTNYAGGANLWTHNDGNAYMSCGVPSRYSWAEPDADIWSILNITIEQFSPEDLGWAAIVNDVVRSNTAGANTWDWRAEGDFVIGASVIDPTFYYSSMDIAALICYSSPLFNSQREQTYNYLAYKWI